MPFLPTFIPSTLPLTRPSLRQASQSSTKLPNRVTASRRPARTPRMVEIVPPDSTVIPELEALDPASGSVIIAPSFNLAGACLFTGGLAFYQGDIWVVLGFPVLLLGVLLAVQSFRVRFVFGPTRMSVAARKGDGLRIIRGWRYDQFTNWEFWWKSVPILTYFKEAESYDGRGSIHFFPIVCNGKQLLEQLQKNTPHLDKSEYS